MKTNPIMLILGGPNGAGKSTVAGQIYHDIYGIDEFVNADNIAKGVSPYNAYANALEAGKIMLKRIKYFTHHSIAFGFETTMAGKTWIKLIETAKKRGFYIVCIFIELSSPDLAVKRVAERVKKGGHHIEKKVIRRRFLSGKRNFWNIYRHLSDEWGLFDNSSNKLEKIAENIRKKINIYNRKRYDQWLKKAENNH